jgi:hypothetical protein
LSASERWAAPTIPGIGRSTLGLPVLNRSLAALTIVGGVWLTPRIGVGVEFLKPGAVEVGYSNTDLAVSVDQIEDETVFAVTGRIRAWRSSRTTVELTGGVGPLLQGSRDVVISHQVVTTTNTDQQTTNAWLAGVDISVSVAQHLAISPLGRIYAFSRNRTRDTFMSYGSSARLLAGVVAVIGF